LLRAQDLPRGDLASVKAVMRVVREIALPHGRVNALDAIGTPRAKLVVLAIRGMQSSEHI
jgi:hypothetical protein